MTTTNDIRSTFLNFFQDRDHQVVDSSPLVPRNDPSLLFTNAGMVQFKNVFTGEEQRPYHRATTSQKCVRAGGKHNDLDNVGYTARHHTFFEMLGNFSFGDYFKADAIEFAWTLITKDFGIDKNRLLATVYSEDDEAYDLWRKIAGLPSDRIIRIPTSDNFWSMGDTGPCGPCSEIFYDHGEHIAGGPPGSPDEDGDRFIEIWNLVFMQYEQQLDGSRINLPKPSIDTGMGLERIAALLQGKHDNYDIDLMRFLIEASAHASNVDPDGPHKVSHRVIADHLRSSCFLIADGVLPSNEGRGYVLRRIMRRAMRHAHMMGCQEPLMHRLVHALVQKMGGAYPELGRAEALITETMKLEETRFKQLLVRGLRLLEDETSDLVEGGTLSGDVAFRLYDTYGFPLDLTQDALRSRGMKVDEDGFNQAMAKQKAEARKNWSGSGEAATDTVWFDLHDKLGATEFLGYETEDAEGTVVGLVVDGKPVDRAGAGPVAVLLNQTPFYAESGGQMGDAGELQFAAGAKMLVTETQKAVGALHVHVGMLEEGASISVGESVRCLVDGERRSALRAHHSATHLLHAALRRHLGDHVTQKGSLVAPDRLRFDISHPKPITAEERTLVEAEVNSQIRRNAEVVTRLMDPESAIEAGAMALFGEKYGEEVRVVSMGTGAADDPHYSVELCGGTHVNRMGDIGMFKIVAEGAVASGVRRIEAVVGEAAEHYVADHDGILFKMADTLKAPVHDLPDRLLHMIEERKRLERELADTRKKMAMGGAAASEGPKQVAGVGFIGRVLEDVPAKDLKGMADEFKKQVGTGVVVLIASSEGKASVVVAVTEDALDRFNSVDLVRVASAALGGKGGGGRPDMAQAGGPDASKANAAIEAIEAAMAG
jgi:alanyl-tRNA synthetase